MKQDTARMRVASSDVIDARHFVPGDARMQARRDGKLHNNPTLVGPFAAARYLPSLVRSRYWNTSAAIAAPRKGPIQYTA